MTDIIIIGAGPAGLTAAIYALRAGKSVLLLEKGALGGQMTFSPKIENYPGFPAVSGNELADHMTEQALALGAEIELGEVTKLELVGDVKKVTTDDGVYEARAVIVATGAKHRHLGLPDEESFIGSGVSFCAVCDGDFYRDGSVLVVGGGNSAMQEALLLSDVCRQVTMVQNLAFLTGEQALMQQIEAKKNVRVIFESVADAYLGDGECKGLRIRNTATGETTDLFADGVFVAIGLQPDTAAFADLLPLENGYVKAGETCETGIPGVYTAGDCRTKAIRQVTTAAADGAVAALAAVRYLG